MGGYCCYYCWSNNENGTFLVVAYYLLINRHGSVLTLSGCRPLGEASCAMRRFDRLASFDWGGAARGVLLLWGYDDDDYYYDDEYDEHDNYDY
jgi:hypothetical protein